MTLFYHLKNKRFYTGTIILDMIGDRGLASHVADLNAIYGTAYCPLDTAWSDP